MIDGKEDGNSLVLFEDPETQAFYENLPDLKAVVPAVLLGLTEEKEEPEEEGNTAAAVANTTINTTNFNANNTTTNTNTNNTNTNTSTNALSSIKQEDNSSSNIIFF